LVDTRAQIAHVAGFVWVNKLSPTTCQSGVARRWLARRIVAVRPS
jgi:hypothetical protein